MNKSFIRILTLAGATLGPVVLKEFMVPIVRAAARWVVEQMKRKRDAETDPGAADPPAPTTELAVRNPYDAIRQRLAEVRDAVQDATSPKVDLRQYMGVEEPAWKVYSRVWGTPGYKTRKATVLLRLDGTIWGLEEA